MIQPDDPDRQPLLLASADEAALDRARKWAMVVYVPGLIVGVIAAVLAVAVAIGTRFIKRDNLLLVVGSFVFVTVVLTLYSVALQRYAGGLRAHRRGDRAGLQRAFAGLRLLWMYVTIFTSLGALATLGMAVARLLGFKVDVEP